MLAEETCLRSGPAEGAVAFGYALVCAVKAQPFAMNLEQTLGGRPVFALSSHPFTKLAGIHFAAARLKNTTDYPVSFGW